MGQFLLILLYVAVAIFGWYCWTTLARRLGYESPGLIGLGMIVPVISLFVFLFLVFSESPNEQILRGMGRQNGPLEEGPREELRERAEPPPSTCPACGAAITPDHTRCPSCDIVLR